jgi:TolB-like protein/DNA-binding winged helix-turn-helix (wHTH) protein/tetratricopeptide (TPR) repeat protein
LEAPASKGTMYFLGTAAVVYSGHGRVPMEKPSPLSEKVGFGRFEIDTRSGEIHKNGRKIRLPEQPFRILQLLLERPGDVVTREELRLKLWPADTFVDFDHGLNNAISKIREVLGDSADTPRFVETLPRRGYRFIAPVDVEAHGGAPAVAPVSPPAVDGEAGLRPAPGRVAHLPLQRWLAAIATGGVVIATVVLLFALNLGGVRDRWAGIVGAKQAAPFTRIQSIAVLPLENLTGDPAQEYVVDGIHDELITQLAQVSSLKVISRTSVMRYKKEKPPLREIGRELGVEGVLEGSVRRAGDRLHVTAQLISVREDRHLWAHSYERDLRGVSVLASEVARTVAQQLNVPLTPQEQALLSNAKPVDPAAYAAYLKGKYFAQKVTNGGLHKAIEFFREAIDRDPGYAPAWAEMGNSYEFLSGYGLRGDDLSKKDALLRSRAAVERAIALDPTLGGPHQALGTMKLNEWDWEGAGAEFQRAHDLDPNYGVNSFYLIMAGRLEGAVAAARRTVERDPLAYSEQLFLGWTYFYARRYDESIVALKRAVELDPRIHHAHYELAWNYAMKSMFGEAISECDTSLALMRRTQPEAVAAVECGWVYGLAGRHRQALEIARQLQKSAGEVENYTIVAHIYDAVGQRDKAFAWLEKAYKDRDPWLPRQWNMPFVSDELRADLRFQELMSRTGNPWAKFPPNGQSLASAVKKPL